MDLMIVGSNPIALDRFFLIGRKFEDECLNTKSKFISFDFGFLAAQQRVKFSTNI